MRAAKRAPDVIARRAAYWTPERKQQAREEATAKAADPGWQAKVRVRTAEALARPEVKERQRAALADPAVKERISKRTREAMADPEVRQRIIDGMAKARACPDRAAKAADGVRCAFEPDHILIELQALCDAWTAARESVRRKFLADVFGPLWGATK